jgi:RNA-directed DNA polymerase
VNSPFRVLHPKEKEFIREQFYKICSNEELYLLLTDILKAVAPTDIARELYGYQLDWIYKNGYPTVYHFFTIKKKSGADRKIASPEPALKLLQRLLSILLDCCYEPHSQVFGFRRGSSIIDNARQHIGKYYVFNVDIENFFPSINIKRVKAALLTLPFEINVNKEPIAYQIAKICCYDPIRNLISGVSRHLPQGAPTSPILSNLVCSKMDFRIDGIAKKHNVIYSRYADDLTFSADYNAFFDGALFRNEVEYIIGQFGFKLNANKTRLQKNTEHQEVTGLTVNEKVNISRDYIKTVRRYLYLWERYGILKAFTIYLSDTNANFIPFEGSLLVEILRGKLNFLRMVSGDNLRYQKLLFKASQQRKTTTIRSFC